MAIQDKSKEELISELQQLQHENISLKTSFAKKIAEYNLELENLQMKKMNFDAVFESSPVAMLIIDETTNIVMVNLAAVKLCGGSESDILQHRPGNALRCVHSHEDSRGCGYSRDCKSCEVRNGIEALIAMGGSIHGAELEFVITKNGAPQQIWMNVGVEPLMIDGRKHWCIALDDITEQKIAVLQLKESQTLLNAIIDSTNDMIWSVDAVHFGLIQWNTSFHDYFLNERGIEIGIGMTLKDLFPVGSDFIPFWMDLFNRTLEKGSITQEYETFSQTRILQVNLELLVQNGRTFGISVFAKNITAQKKAEEKIRLSEEKFRAAFMTIKDGFYIGTLKEGLIIEVNSGFEDIFQYNPQESIGKTSSELGLWAVPEDRAIMVSQLQEKGYCNNLETMGRKKNGQLFHVSITASILNIHQVPHIVGVIRDITERKFAEEEIVRAKNKAEENERKYHKLFNEMIDGFAYHEIIFDSNGHPIDYVTLKVNKAFEKYLKLPAELVVGQKVSTFLSDEELKHWLGIFGPVAITGQSADYKMYSPQNQKYFEGKAYCPVKGKFAVTFSDITEQRIAEIEIKKAQEKVQESEYRLKLAIASGKLGIWDWNLVENTMIWDDRMFELYGITRETFPHNIDAWTNGLHPEDKQTALNECNSALNGEREFNTSFRVLHPDGSVLYLKANGSVLRDENGKPKRMIGINRDITEGKIAEQALTESEEQYRSLFQKSHAVMLILDSETGTIMDANPAACRFYGWSLKELLKKPIYEINLSNKEEIKNDLLLAQNEKRNHFIFKHRLANGSIRDVEEYSSPLVVAGKTILYSIIHDITDRKLAEEALLESEKRIQKKLANLLSPESDISELSLEDIIDTDAIQSMMEEFFKFTKIPVAIIDLQGKVLVGPGWQDICTKFHRIHPETLAHCIECDTVLTKGIPQGSFKSYLCKNSLWDNATPMIVGGRHVGNLFTGQFFYEGEKPDDEVFRKQAARYGFDEKDYMEAVNRVPIYSRETIYHALTFFINLSNMISTLSHANIGLAKVLEQQKQIEKELIIAKDKAEESDRLKSAFLANMSHEIRTPLNGIIGFSELLNNPDFDQEQKTEFTKTIIENGNNLLVIINDIMDLSMLEAHQIKIKKEQFAINKLFIDLKNEFSAKVSDKGLKFQINIPSDFSDRIIESDYYRIRQIFNNLVGNALKFTNCGFIEIGFLPIENSVEFFVKDTGIGIGSENHDDIFERFRQVEGSKTRKYGGNGLGLAISKNLVQVLGGKIWLKSEIGKGSTFYFTIPLE